MNQMSRGRRGSVVGDAGFTVIETLIVLAVSSMMFLGAVLLVAGQQRKVEFRQAVGDIESVVNQTISEVSNGYYPNAGNIVCTVTGRTINITTPPSGNPQGTNKDCIFLGKAIQFSDSGDADKYVVISMTGLQNNDGTLDGVNPQALNVNNSRDISMLRNGLTVTAMRYMPANRSVSSVAFVNGLGVDNSGQELMSGSTQVAMVPVPGTQPVPNATIANTNDRINNQLDEDGDDLINPPHDTTVQICFQGSSDQYAQMNIGGNGRNVSVKMTIRNSQCW